MLISPGVPTTHSRGGESLGFGVKDSFTFHIPKLCAPGKVTSPVCKVGKEKLYSRAGSL